MLGRILLLISSRMRFLHRICISANHVAGRFWLWHAAYTDRVASNLHLAFRTDKGQPFAFLASIYKVTRRLRLKPSL